MQSKVYHVNSSDGRVFIVAENHGVVPITVWVRADLHHMQSSVKLPVRLLVAPTEQPFVLTTLTPEPYSYPSFHYYTSAHLGKPLAHGPDTSHVYRLPYAAATVTLPKRLQQRTTPAPRHYLYTFELPANTPVCAARAGVVVSIHQSTQHSRHINDNLICVMHADGGYACYANIKPNSAVGAIGRRVAAGDTIAYFSGTKRIPHLGFAIEYFPDSLSAHAPTLFQLKDRVIHPN